jgi:hypothetical protein
LHVTELHHPQSNPIQSNPIMASQFLQYEEPSSIALIKVH